MEDLKPTLDIKIKAKETFNKVVNQHEKQHTYLLLLVLFS